MVRLPASNVNFKVNIRYIVFILIWIAYLFISASSGKAQTADFKYYTVHEGLLSNAITALCQDSNGYLWIGTTDGLTIYDGLSFRNLTVADGLASNSVNCIEEDLKTKGVMWVGTNDAGVTRCSMPSMTKYRMGTSNWSNRVNSLAQDKDGTVYCSTDDGIYKIEDGLVSPLSKDYQRGSFGLIKCKGDSLIFVDHSGYLVSYELGNGVTHVFDRRLHNLSGFGFDSENHLWVSFHNGDLVDFADRKFVHGPFGKGMTFLIDDRIGNLWVGTLQGVYRFNKEKASSGQLIHITTANGLQGNEILAGLVDAEGDIWFGSRVSGLSKLFGLNTFTVPVDYPTIAINNSQAASDRRGHIWILEEKGLLEIWFSEPGVIKNSLHLFRSMGISSVPASIQITDGKKVWIASPAGVIRCFHIDEKANSSFSLRFLGSFSLKRILPKSTLLCFIIDREGRAWCSYTDIGVLEFNTHIGFNKGLVSRKDFKIYSSSDGLPDNSIRAIFEDGTGNLWFGGYIGGLAKLTYNSAGVPVIKLYTTEDGLPDNSIRSIIEDSSGGLWIGTRYGGIAIIHESVFKIISVKDGLATDAIWAMSYDKGRGSFLATQLGLQQLKESGTSELLWQSYGEKAPVYSCGVSSSNLLWVCGIGNVLVSDLSEVSGQAVAPHIFIAGLTVNGVETKVDSLHDLPYYENTMTINFTGISLKEGKELKYQYRLVGVDKNWHSSFQRLPVTYALLRPGKYSFEVKAINSSGLESTAEMPFVIVSPYWMEWWFIATAGIVLISLVYLAIRIKVRRLIEIERVRSAIATDLHDDIGSGLTRIAILADVALRQTASQEVVGAERETVPENSENFSAGHLIYRISENARELVDSMGDVVWSIDPKNISATELLTRIRSFAQEMCDGKGVSLAFEVDDKLQTMHLDPRILRTLLLITKEGLNNAVKHSQSKSVRVEMRIIKKEVELRISDDGIGFSVDHSLSGHGLLSMQNRSKKQGGTFKLSSSLGKGTTIDVRIPISI